MATAGHVGSTGASAERPSCVSHASAPGLAEPINGSGPTYGGINNDTPNEYCVLSDGDAGGFDPATPRSQIPQIRRAEQTEAAALLGVNDVRFFGLGEGGFR